MFENPGEHGPPLPTPMGLECPFPSWLSIGNRPCFHGPGVSETKVLLGYLGPLSPPV